MDGIQGMGRRPGTDAVDALTALLARDRASAEPLPRKIATGKNQSEPDPAVPSDKTTGKADLPRRPDINPNRLTRQIRDRADFSLPEKMREAAAPVASLTEKDSDGGARQLTFSFYGSMKEEAAASFELKLGRLAAEDNSPSAQAVVSLGYRLSASFSLSGSISGEALKGFGNAAEMGLKSFNSREFLDKFIALTSRMLESLPGDLNEWLSLFSSGNARDNKETLETLVNRMFEKFFGGTRTAQSIRFSASVQMEFSFEISGQFAATAEEAAQSDPLVLDLNGDGQLNLTSAAAGARFDILGKGSPVQTAFVTGGDAFLALDRNGNGTIDSGLELFGDQYGAANGFEELRKFDGNGDSVIDSRDQIFSSLRLWQDNGSGTTEPGELLSLADAGVTAILLNYKDVNKIAAGGNRVAQVAAYQRTDGRYGLAGDVLLNYIG